MTELRQRYLAHYLAPYVTAGVDIEALGARSGGTTQAFLKDWVHRAVQIATERLAAPGDKVELRTQDFDTALREARTPSRAPAAASSASWASRSA